MDENNIKCIIEYYDDVSFIYDMDVNPFDRYDIEKFTIYDYIHIGEVKNNSYLTNKGFDVINIDNDPFYMEGETIDKFSGWMLLDIDLTFDEKSIMQYLKNEILAMIRNKEIDAIINE